MPGLAAHPASTSISQLLVSLWWVFLLVGGWILNWVAEVFDIGLSAMRRRSKLRHKRRIELIREQAKAAAAAAARRRGS